MGSPPMNICRAKVDGGKLILNEDNHIKWQGDPQALRNCTEVLVGMRPEHFQLHNKNHLNTEFAKFSIQANLIEHTGADQFILFKLNGSDFTARISAEHEINSEQLQLTVSHDKLYLFDAETEQAIES